MTKYDFCIVGNGMVGSATAIAIAKQGFSIAWIRPEMLEPYSKDSPPDLRVSAINQGSVNLLDALGIWDWVTQMRHNPYTKLSAWEDEDAPTEFTAEMIGESQLGYFVENRLIQLACAQRAEHFANIDFYDNAGVSHIEFGETNHRLTLQNERAINANWLAGVDGAQSIVRRSTGIETTGWQYSQHAMGIMVELQNDSGHETWQQFNSTGPRALLPLYGNAAALIWYDQPERLKSLKKLPKSELVQVIERAFPNRLPAIKKVLSTGVFPLTRMHAKQYVKGRTVLLGDAAHTVNPLAGQGVNMGFNDLQAFIQCLESADKKSMLSGDWALKLKSEYEKKQKVRHQIMFAGLEAIYQVFGSNNAGLKMLRKMGLGVAEKSGPLKQQAIRFAAGL